MKRRQDVPKSGRRSRYMIERLREEAKKNERLQVHRLRKNKTPR